MMDCGDSSCLFATDRSGQRTNGGCRCLDGASKLARAKLAKEMRELRAEVERWKDLLRRFYAAWYTGDTRLLDRLVVQIRQAFEGGE